MILIYSLIFLFDSISSSSLYLKSSGRPVFKFNLNFINSKYFTKLIPSVSAYVIDFDEFNLDSLNISLSDYIFMTKNQNSFINNFKWLNSSIGLIIPQYLSSIKNLEKEKNIKVFIISDINYEELEVYINYDSRDFISEILYDSDYTIFNFGLFIVLIVFSFVLLFATMCIYFIKYRSRLNNRLQIHYLLLFIPLPLGLVCILEYLSYSFSDSYYKCYPFNDLLEIGLTCLFAIEKALILTSIIQISPGWIILYFKKKKMSIEFTFLGILLTDFLLDVIVHLFQEKEFHIPPIYYLELKNSLEILGIMIYCIIRCRKPFIKTYKQYQYELKTQSEFIEAFKMKYNIYLSFLVALISYFIAKITVFLIHFFFISYEFSYPFFFADHIFIETLFGCSLMLIFIPRPLSDFYLMEMGIEVNVFIANIQKTNEFRELRLNTLPIVLINPSGITRQWGTKEITEIYNLVAINIGFIENENEVEREEVKNCFKYVKDAFLEKIYQN